MTPSTSFATSSPNSDSDLVDVGFGVLDDVVEQRRGDRLLVEPELRADARDADGMLDERRARAPLLALVRRRREREGARDELAVDCAAGFLDLCEQLVEKTLVLLTCLDRRHRLSVLRASGAVSRAEGLLVYRSK